MHQRITRRITTTTNATTSITIATAHFACFKYCGATTSTTHASEQVSRRKHRTQKNIAQKLMSAPQRTLDPKPAARLRYSLHELDPRRSDNTRTRCVSLISQTTRADQPHFKEEERAAVHDFIEGGGGMMVICEHTNAYRGAEKINPLISPLGLTLRWTAALVFT